VRVLRVLIVICLLPPSTKELSVGREHRTCCSARHWNSLATIGNFWRKSGKQASSARWLARLFRVVQATAIAPWHFTALWCRSRVCRRRTRCVLWKWPSVALRRNLRAFANARVCRRPWWHWWPHAARFGQGSFGNSQGSAPISYTIPYT